ncbi:hypothetical protein JHN55_25240 [Streptomyces sp. MBT56]|uniref:hypothetical protein n=1 Tax=unclassified Streptomyces TaxID=2593676 RepID=UPI00190AFF85|nr:MULTISPECIES: hypothetical protein [unclassified Streptomyces]MBK3559770.1 hypothetical protein [Streptomyces sp. MBT56]MBK3601288.1 hypothetical protein [Streptomyces sp. MBT54]MBK3615265.1 hypothetical protein [Streptomyces sp. MBT98]
MSGTPPRSDEHNHDAPTQIARGTAQPGKTLRLLLGGYQPNSLQSFSLRIDNVNYEVFIHTDRTGDKTLWCKVYNRKKEKLDVEFRAPGGSDADNPTS